MLKTFSLLTVLMLGTPLAQAAPAPESNARWFRYIDDRGQPNVTDMVTPQHVERGYDELTAGMRVIRHVPGQKTLTAEEVAAVKAKHEQQQLQEKEDRRIRRLYSSPQDAEKARNRRLDALQLRIDFSANSMASLRQRRAEEARKAATFQRTGKPVPADMKEGIAAYDRQIQSAQKEIDARKAEQERVRAEYAPIIRRLSELTGKPVSAAAATPAAAPAPVTAASVTPAAPVAKTPTKP